jgi:hypothetical protein
MNENKQSLSEDRVVDSALAILSGILCNDRSGKLTALDTYRRYVSTMSMSTSMRSLPDATNKSILYEIGLSGMEQATMLKHIVEPEDQMTQVVQMSDVVSFQLAALHKKFTNFTGTYDYMDLSAIGFQLAKGIAKYNNTGSLTATELRGGKPLNIRGLGIPTDPISSNSAAVFIPRTAATIQGPSAFNALVSAVNAYGSTVYTDVLEMDGNNCPVMMDYADGALVSGCYAGLRILLSMYDLGGNGAVMAYAITRGFHAMNTVVGHSDEGGFMRTVLRKGGFKSPFGGIFMDNVTAYNALPMPSPNNDSQLCACIDSILLSTAAAVTVADPCIRIEDRVYPSIYSTDATGHDRKIDLGRKIALDGGAFSEAYIAAIAKIFGVSGNIERASNHLFNCMTWAARSPERHLGNETVAPFYWIEPTTILKKCFGTVAENEGFGSLVSVGCDVEVDALPKCRVAVQNGPVTLIGYEHRTARTVPLINYLQGHRLDGLANIRPMNYIAEKMVLKGGQHSAEQSRNLSQDIGWYVWGRGQCSITAPAECTYIGSVMGAMIKHHTFDDLFSVLPTHMYNPGELCSARIKMSASRPVRIKDGPLSSFDKHIQRERTAAAKAMENARAYMYNFGMTGGEQFIASNSELIFISDDKKPEGSVVRGEAIVDESREPMERKGAVSKRVVVDQPLRPIVARPPVTAQPIIVRRDAARDQTVITGRAGEERLDEIQADEITTAQPTEQ